MSSKNSSDIMMSQENFPPEFVGYFNLNKDSLTSVSKQQLSEIYEFAKSEDKTIGDILQELKATEKKLGPTSYQETRYGKLWHYMKLSNRIIELEKQREAMHNDV